jgi:hypothetical protein
MVAVGRHLSSGDIATFVRKSRPVALFERPRSQYEVLTSPTHNTIPNLLQLSVMKTVSMVTDVRQ